MANDLDLIINKLSLETGVDRNTLSIAIRRGEIYLHARVAELADAAIFDNEPGFIDRWERKIRLTFDPTRVVLWQRIGVDTNTLVRIFQLTDPKYCWQRISGDLWMSEKQFKDLIDWVSSTGFAKELRATMPIGGDEYRIRQPIGAKQPKIKVLRPDELTPKEKANAR